jgi:hypothetical protein
MPERAIGFAPARARDGGGTDAARLLALVVEVVVVEVDVEADVVDVEAAEEVGAAVEGVPMPEEVGAGRAGVAAWVELEAVAGLAEGAAAVAAAAAALAFLW